MNIVLLSGGSGKRLWPLSNDVRSKQFLRFFKREGEEEEYESMVQRVYRQIRNADPEANVTIATGKNQVSSIFNQLGGQVEVCVEPCRRDTFPAILLATVYLCDQKNLSPDEIIIVCPVDPYVEEDYFEALKELEKNAKRSDANLSLMGIEPTYPSEKYGYIIPEKTAPVSSVKSFQEKPDVLTAERYIRQGALWNAGIFAFRAEYLLQKAHEVIDFDDYEELFAKYEELPKISFDYAVVEKEEKIDVIRFSGKWKDLGTWNTLTEEMDENTVGHVLLNDRCENVHVINELNIPVLCMGLKNMVVCAGAEGILVSDKEQSSYIKPFVEQIHQQVMFAEKSWGSYQVLDVQEDSLTILVTLKPGHSMNYHSHEHRDEVWTVISGRGRTIVDGMEQSVGVGDVITMQAGCRHTIAAVTELKVVEVQLGREISVYDKQKYALGE